MCAVFFATSIAVSARDAAGLLDIVITPNDGMPAMGLPGAEFEVLTTAQAELSIEANGATHALTPQWSDALGGRKHALCTIPADAAPGLYALRARGADREDVNLRSVCVCGAFPETYTVAHITDTHIGSNRNARTSEDIFTELIQKVNATQAAFVLVTGDLTESGEPEQFKHFLDILNTCTLPTFVCSGNHDRKELNYERTFGPDSYVFWFGKDGYLFFDTKDFYVAEDLGPQAADIERQRRALKSARWSIGASHRYEADMGMRTQLALFIDDPLDWFIFGHWHRENTAQEKSVPWAAPDGATRITVTPAAINGAMRLFEIGPAGIVPGEVQTVVKVK
ncbi:MAG: metallophosphoesterase [Candidatus Hydrogenedentes bacterium]|nr:metallophosphoesterase [Candidatus Hydrogenedentota bacterium]